MFIQSTTCASNCLRAAFVVRKFIRQAAGYLALIVRLAAGVGRRGLHGAGPVVSEAIIMTMTANVIRRIWLFEGQCFHFYKSGCLGTIDLHIW